jgi:hypothetical protein
MRRLSLLAFLLAIFLALTGLGYARPVEADLTVSQDPAHGVGISKGIVGQGGMRCHGEATKDGYTFRLTIYEAQDKDDQDTPRELAWQRSECVYDLEQQIGWWFAQPYDNWYCHGSHMIDGKPIDDLDGCYSKPAIDYHPHVKDGSIFNVSMDRI